MSVKHVSELEGKILVSSDYIDGLFKIKKRTGQYIILERINEGWKPFETAIYPATLVRLVNDPNGSWKVKAPAIINTLNKINGNR